MQTPSTVSHQACGAAHRSAALVSRTTVHGFASRIPRATQCTAFSAGASTDNPASSSEAAAAKRARLHRLAPDPAPVDPVLPPAEEGRALRQRSGRSYSRPAAAGGGSSNPLTAYEPLPHVDSSDGTGVAADWSADANNTADIRNGEPTNSSHPTHVEDISATTAMASSSTSTSDGVPDATGAFVRSRGRALRRLQQRQRALLTIAAQPPQLRGGRRPVPDAPAGSLTAETTAGGDSKQAPGAPSSNARPYHYTVARDGRITKAEVLERRQQQQQQRRTQRMSLPGAPAAALADDLRLLLGSAAASSGTATGPVANLPQVRAAGSQGKGRGDGSSSRGSGSRGESAATVQGPDATPGVPLSPPPVTLRVFTYCITHADLKRALWAAGLPPGAVVFVTALRDADLVLHLVPAPGEKQFAYHELRSQASERGIPFVSVRSLHPDDLLKRLSKAQASLRREAVAARGQRRYGGGRGRGRSQQGGLRS